MPKFSKISDERLNTCHPLLQTLMREVVKNYDCAILCGHRNKEDQDKAFEGGFSKVKFPNSKHNQYPSLAVDAAPVPIQWQNREKFIHFAGYVKGIADKIGIKIRCGIDFNNDGNFKNDNLFDGPHFQIEI